MWSHSVKATNPFASLVNTWSSSAPVLGDLGGQYTSLFGLPGTCIFWNIYFKAYFISKLNVGVKSRRFILTCKCNYTSQRFHFSFQCRTSLKCRNGAYTPTPALSHAHASHHSSPVLLLFAAEWSFFSQEKKKKMTIVLELGHKDAGLKCTAWGRRSSNRRWLKRCQKKKKIPCSKQGWTNLWINKEKNLLYFGEAMVHWTRETSIRLWWKRTPFTPATPDSPGERPRGTKLLIPWCRYFLETLDENEPSPKSVAGVGQLANWIFRGLNTVEMSGWGKLLLMMKAWRRLNSMKVHRVPSSLLAKLLNQVETRFGSEPPPGNRQRGLLPGSASENHRPLDMGATGSRAQSLGWCRDKSLKTLTSQVFFRQAENGGMHDSLCATLPSPPQF